MNTYMTQLLELHELSMAPDEVERRFLETLRPDQRTLPEELLDGKRRVFVAGLRREADGKPASGATPDENRQ